MDMRNVSWNTYQKFQVVTSWNLFFVYILILICCSTHGFQVTTRICDRSPSGISSHGINVLRIHTKNEEGEENNTQILDLLEVGMKNSFSCANLASTKCWGKRPLLMRGAFRSHSKLFINSNVSSDDNCGDNSQQSPPPFQSSFWPSWDEVVELALEEDAESRLITHVPEDPTSWRLRLGPFEQHDLDSLDFGSSSGACGDSLVEPNEKWTMVLNDVDRFYPPLFDFITDTFSFIPQWRKDDGQISLSNSGGGIGPHTDDYDVFLIQMSGRRKWDVGKRTISTKEELQNLQNGLDVRILNFWDSEVQKGLVESYTLEPGDVMYLPPRIAHCGTALSDGCMTLSVGLRAPSAKEMMTKMTEYVDGIVDGDFMKRYTDPDLFNNYPSNNSTSSSPALVNLNEITNDVKTKSRQLLKDAILNLLDDDLFFDDFFGKIVTESKRLRTNYPLSLDELDDDEIQDLGEFSNAKLCVQSMLSGRANLFAAEGIPWTYSVVEKEKGLPYVCRLFVDGRKWEIDVGCDVDYRTKIINLIGTISIKKELSGDMFIHHKPIPQQFQNVLEDLVQEGYLYGSEAQ